VPVTIAIKLGKLLDENQQTPYSIYLYNKLNRMRSFIMSEVHQDFSALSKALSQILSFSSVEQVAKQEGFVERSKKLTGFPFLCLCAFQEHVGKESLSKLCASLYAHFDVEISTEGLNQRFSKPAVDFLKQIFQSLFQIQNPILSLSAMDFFERIRILDSTSFGVSPNSYESYGGYHGSGVKIQLEYDLKAGEFVQWELQEQKDSDQAFANLIQSSVKPNDLCIRDLGYFSTPELRTVSERKGFFISRLHPQTGIYNKLEDGSLEKVDLSIYHEELNEGEYLEIPVLVGKKELVPVRLIIYKLDEDQLQRRKETLKKREKKKGVKFTTQRNKHVVLNTLITNIPQSNVKATDIYSIYSLRWQIEILFKIWKSIFEVDQVKKMKQERFECYLYGRFIALLLGGNLLFRMRFHLYTNKQLQLSEYKGMEIIKTFMISIPSALKKGKKSIQHLLMKIFAISEKIGLKSRRYKKQTPLDIMFSL
jgi:hypothetical protein